MNSAPQSPIAINQTQQKIAIMMCTYNGERYLADQLNSFSAQNYSNWEVWASDDGSQDETLSILETYRAKWGGARLFIRSGPAAGFVANFLTLLCKAEIQADCYAYSDHDDIWDEDKLQRAMDWLSTISKDIPALYCSRTRLVDADNQEIGFSPFYRKPPSFANALMQNIGGGNTMVFNNAAREILRKAGDKLNVFAHDWWTYIVVTGCGGRVSYDAYPSLRYRQHGNNVLGVSSSWSARFVRLKKMWQGNARKYNDQHIQALQHLRSELTLESSQILDRFAFARDQGFFSRLIGIKKSGVYRQTLLGNLALIFATILKKL